MKTNDTTWQKAQASTGGGGCIEMRRRNGRAEVRDSKSGDDSPLLTFNRKELSAFLDGAKKGEFDHLLDGLS